MTSEHDTEEDEEYEELPERATPLLAVVRIICVLGMALGVSLGLFLALGFWWIPSLIAFAAAVPFFVLMRFMEKHAGN
jgi:putative flippase GtrA